MPTGRKTSTPTFSVSRSDGCELYSASAGLLYKNCWALSFLRFGRSWLPYVRTEPFGNSSAISVSFPGNNLGQRWWMQIRRFYRRSPEVRNRPLNLSMRGSRGGPRGPWPPPPHKILLPQIVRRGPRGPWPPRGPRGPWPPPPYKILDPPMLSEDLVQKFASCS